MSGSQESWLIERSQSAGLSDEPRQVPRPRRFEIVRAERAR
jgi:hypothetical protein